MTPDRGSGSPIDLEAIAAELFAILGTGRQIPSFSALYPDLTLDDAYRIADAIRKLRESIGEQAVGRKIGFTNRAAWANFAVTSPIWGYMYDRTVRYLAEGDSVVALSGMSEPRIEPELVLKLASRPTPGMGERALLGCVAWVAHGFEIVQSIYPGWVFTAADAVAAFGVHRGLLIGSPRSVSGDEEQWFRSLSTFDVDMERDGATMAHGHARDVLGGPLTALRHLVDVLGSNELRSPLAAGEIITTGTLTRAFPATAGETWSTKLSGISLDGVTVTFT